MKFLVLLALVSLASGYKQFIQVDGRNVITDDGRAGSRGGGAAGGLGGASASGRIGGGALSGGFGGAGSLSFGSGAGGAGGASYGAGASLGGSFGRLSSGSKGLGGSLSGTLSPAGAIRASGGYGGGDAASLLGSIRSKQVATPVINVAPAIPVIAEQQNVFSSGQQSSQFSSLAGGFGGFDSASASVVPQGGVVQAAVITKYRVQYVDVPSQGGEAQVQQIVIPAKRQPLEISFESASSPVKVNLVHIPGKASEPQVSSHQEEPDLLKSEIIKPIIHEVIEAIQPIRKVTQEVRPVLETINQIISRGQSVQVAGASTGIATGSVTGVSADSAATLGAKPISAQFGQVAAIAQPVQQQISQELIEKKKRKAA